MQEPGKEEPESLYQQWLMVLKKIGYIDKEAYASLKYMSLVP